MELLPNDTCILNWDGVRIYIKENHWNEQQLTTLIHIIRHNCSHIQDEEWKLIFHLCIQYSNIQTFINNIIEVISPCIKHRIFYKKSIFQFYNVLLFLSKKKSNSYIRTWANILTFYPSVCNHLRANDEDYEYILQLLYQDVMKYHLRSCVYKSFFVLNEYFRNIVYSSWPFLLTGEGQLVEQCLFTKSLQDHVKNHTYYGLF
jgi:hypothetical protein